VVGVSGFCGLVGGRVVRVRRYGFDELSEEAFKYLDRAIEEAVRGEGKPLREILKEIKS